MSPLPVAGCSSTIGAPDPPVSQYQSCVPGSGAMASLAGACTGIGMGVIGLVWLSAETALSTAKPRPTNRAQNGRANRPLRIIALLPSRCSWRDDTPRDADAKVVSLVSILARRLLAP